MSAVTPTMLPAAGAAPTSPVFVITAIGGIYIAQTLVSGLAFTALPTVLRSQGVPLERIGLVWLVMLPWLLKFLWSGAVERYRLPTRGARRSRLIVTTGQMVMAAMLGLLALQAPDDVMLVIGLLAVIALFAATVDIACDAFAVEQLSRANRGWGNVAQVGGSYLGLALGSGLFLYLFEHVGWQPAVLVLAAIMGVLSMPFLAARESEVAPRVAGADRPSLKAAFSRPAVRLGLMITVLFETSGRLAMAMIGPFMIDGGFSPGDVGILSGMGGSIAGLCGTFLGGLAFRLWGEWRSLCLVLAVKAACLADLAIAALAAAPSMPLLVVLVIALKLASAAGFVVLFATLMGFASLKQAGVDFTLFQCMSAGVAMVGGALGGLMAASFGFAGCFGLAAGLACLAGLVTPGLIRRALAQPEAAHG